MFLRRFLFSLLLIGGLSWLALESANAEKIPLVPSSQAQPEFLDTDNADDLKLIEKALADTSLSSAESRSIAPSVLLAYLDQSNHELRNAELAEILFRGFHLEQQVSAYGFVQNPKQAPNLYKSFEKMLELFRTGKLNGEALASLKGAREALSVLWSVQKEVRELFPDPSWQIIPMGDVVMVVQNGKAGLLAPLEALRRLTSIFRNHLGTFTLKSFDDYFLKPGVPVLASDFNHFSFMEFLASIHIMKRLEILKGKELRQLPELAWREFTITWFETARQLAGLKLANEEELVGEAIEEIIRDALAGLSELEPTLNRLVSEIGSSPLQDENKREAYALLSRVVERLGRKEPRLRIPGLDMVISLQTGATEIRGAATHLPSFARYVTEAGLGDGSKIASLISMGATPVSLICGLPGRACGWVTAPLVAGVSGINSIFSGVFGREAPRRLEPRVCQAILAQVPGR